MSILSYFTVNELVFFPMVYNLLTYIRSYLKQFIEQLKSSRFTIATANSFTGTDRRVHHNYDNVTGRSLKAYVRNPLYTHVEDHWVKYRRNSSSIYLQISFHTLAIMRWYSPSVLDMNMWRSARHASTIFQGAYRQYLRHLLTIFQASLDNYADLYWQAAMQE